MGSHGDLNRRPARPMNQPDLMRPLGNSDWPQRSDAQGLPVEVDARPRLGVDLQPTDPRRPSPKVDLNRLRNTRLDLHHQLDHDQ